MLVLDDCVVISVSCVSIVLAVFTLKLASAGEA